MDSRVEGTDDAPAMTTTLMIQWMIKPPCGALWIGSLQMESSFFHTLDQGKTSAWPMTCLTVVRVSTRREAITRGFGLPREKV
jgi:hypothetical protein